MTFISKYPSINCSEVIAGTREEEKQLRDSYEVKMSVKNANNPEMKKKNYYRLVSGRPTDGAKEGWRRNEWLEETGYFLLDWDYFEKDKNGKPIKKKMNYIDIWNKMKKHTKEWGIVHAEKSARHGLHVTVIRTAGLTIEENIRLMELRTDVDFDHACKDKARACFLVPNEYVVYVNEDLYYSDTIPEPLVLTEEEQELLEKDRKERELKHQQEVEARRRNAPTLDYGGITDEQSLLEHLIDLICEQKVDITHDYENWYRIGFIIANICGLAAGEPLFNKISSLYPSFDYKEASRKFQGLCRDSHQVVKLGTLIHLAKEEGVIK